MKAIIFAGGHGTRLWPLSRKNSPKQFEKFINGASTFQQTIKNVAPVIKLSDIYVSTNEKFAPILKEQQPDLPEANFLLEPAKRDLAPAVGLSFLKLQQTGYQGAVAILWSDSVMKKPENFCKALLTGEELIKQNPEQFVFIGENPTFPNHNLGWISVSKEIKHTKDLSIWEFASWVYRPELELCKKLFKSGKAFWNTGYLITSVAYVLSLYQKYQPKMYAELQKIIANPQLLNQIYPTLESISLDDAITHHTSPAAAKVINTDLGWDDPGTLFALKRVLVPERKENATKGETVLLDTTDSLVFNYEENKVVTTIGLDGYVVVNMNDALLIVHKDKVPDVKKMVAELEKQGKEKYV
ncbi:MAG: sugar phosphate nucleotidyltransferase [bacterium]